MFSLFSRRARYARKKNTNNSTSSFSKLLLSTLLTVGITSGIIYAATLTTVTTQTIVQGDTIGAGWYQAVNDRLLNISLSGGLVSISGSIYAATPTASGQLATKAYVDAAVGAGGGGLKVYKSDGTTLLGYFLTKNVQPITSATDTSLQYTGIDGNIYSISNINMLSITPAGQTVYFKTNNCTGPEYIAGDYASSSFYASGPLTSYLGTDFFIYSLPDGSVYTAYTGFGGYPPNTGSDYYYAYQSLWNNTSCVAGIGSVVAGGHSTLMVPSGKTLKSCGWGNCKIKP